MREILYGRNAVYESLRANRRQPFRLMIAQGAQEKGRLNDILNLAQKKRLPVESVARPQLDRFGEGHQGVALETSGYPYADLEDMFALAAQQDQKPFILILDTLQDPQNLGTLLRTAEAVGVHGVLLPLRQTVTVTPAVVNASSGAAEHLLIAQGNLAQSIDALKQNDVWVMGLEGSPAAQPMEQARLDGGLALVVGSEGQGMRPLVRNKCDGLVRLGMRGQVESLNAAVAGSIALYLAAQKR